MKGSERILQRGSVYYLEKLIERERTLFDLLKSVEADVEKATELSPDILEAQEESIAAVEDQLAAVNEALSAIDQGTYGICIVCGEEIDVELLKEKPERNRCDLHDTVKFLAE